MCDYYHHPVWTHPNSYTDGQEWGWYSCGYNFRCSPDTHCNLCMSREDKRQVLHVWSTSILLINSDRLFYKKSLTTYYNHSEIKLRHLQLKESTTHYTEWCTKINTYQCIWHQRPVCEDTCVPLSLSCNPKCVVHLPCRPAGLEKWDPHLDQTKHYGMPMYLQEHQYQ